MITSSRVKKNQKWIGLDPDEVGHEHEHEYEYGYGVRKGWERKRNR